MDELLDAIAAFVSLVSQDKVNAVASRLRQTDATEVSSELQGMFGTSTARALLQNIKIARQKTDLSGSEVGLMLLAATDTRTRVISEQSTELVWTGPRTPFVSPRRTEQALLQVINAAKRSLFITSFVAYDVSTIVKALNTAIANGVSVSMLLERSQGHGGNITFDGISKMRALIPLAKFFAWDDKEISFVDGSVHAKVAVADDSMCFITSANLTGYAMEKNMEAGVLVTGGMVPKLLQDHLVSMVATNVITKL